MMDGWMDMYMHVQDNVYTYISIYLQIDQPHCKHSNEATRKTCNYIKYSLKKNYFYAQNHKQGISCIHTSPGWLPIPVNITVL